MRRASFPTRRVYPCQKCMTIGKSTPTLMETNSSDEIQHDTPPLAGSPPVSKTTASAKPGAIQKRDVIMTRRSLKRAKTECSDIFSDQEGGKLEMISPVMAAVDQAKALIALRRRGRRRKCYNRKACIQKGARVGKKVYNRRRTRVVKHTSVKRRRSHGTK